MKCFVQDLESDITPSADDSELWGDLFQSMTTVSHAVHWQPSWDSFFEAAPNSFRTGKSSHHPS
jgi:hypothetical protein